MNEVSLGADVQGLILGLARHLTLGQWPGLISFSLFSLFVALANWMGMLTIRRIHVLNGLRKKISETGDGAGFQVGLDDIERDLRRQKSGNARRLADAFSEFRETLLEPSRHGEANARNAFRPATFINLDDLHFGLGGWRVWPGLFVSIGLLLTFLGLIAALAATKQSIEVGPDHPRVALL